MALYFLLVTLLNIGLGFGLAWFLQRRLNTYELVMPGVGQAALPVVPKARALSRKKNDRGNARSLAVSTAESQPEVDAVAKKQEDEKICELPTEWREVLLSHKEKFSNVIEGVVKVMRYEAKSCLELLQKNDRIILQANKTGGIAAPQGIRKALVEVTQRIASFSEKLTALLEQHGYQFDDLTTLAVRIETMVDTEKADAEMIVDELNGLAEESRVEAQIAILSKAFHSLLAMAHRFEDQANDGLAVVLRQTKRLHEVTDEALLDVGSTALNRIAFEQIIADWWAEDPSRIRMLGFVMFDIDSVAKLNHEKGIEYTDELIRKVGGLLNRNLRQNRGFDRFFRFDGQRYLAFLGDTGLENGCNASERLRQTLAKASFVYNGQATEVTLTGAVTDATQTDTVDEIFERLKRGVKRGKRNGGNTTVLVNDGKCEPIDAKPYSVPVLTVNLFDAAAG